MLDLGLFSVNIYGWACAVILARAAYAIAKFRREPTTAHFARSVGFVLLGLELGLFGMLFAENPLLAPPELYKPIVRLGWLVVTIPFAVEVIAMAFEGRKIAPPPPVAELLRGRALSL